MKNIICTENDFRAIEKLLEAHKLFCKNQTNKPIDEGGGCDSCPADHICRKGIYEKVLNFIESNNINLGEIIHE